MSVQMYRLLCHTRVRRPPGQQTRYAGAQTRFLSAGVVAVRGGTTRNRHHRYPVLEASCHVAYVFSTERKVREMSFMPTAKRQLLVSS